MVEISLIKKRTKEIWDFDYGKRFYGNEIVMYYAWVDWCTNSQERSKEKQKIINYLVKNKYIERIANDYYKAIYFQ